MTTETQVKKINLLVDNIKNLLPLYAENELTLRFETDREVQQIAKTLGLIYNKPTANFNFHWCTYNVGRIKVHIQTHDIEQGQTPKDLSLN